MLKLFKKKNPQSTLKPMNVIGIKTNIEYRFPMLAFAVISTLITMYSIVKIEIDSFRLLDDFEFNIYNIAPIRIMNFTESEIGKLHMVLFLGCLIICLVNGIGKHHLRTTIILFLAYLSYFGWHYKYVANGFVHLYNKAAYCMFALRGHSLSSSSFHYSLPYYEIYDVKTEIVFALMTVVFGTCFVLAFSAINHCNPIMYTGFVCIYTALPFVCSAFVGEKYLVVCGISCILLFVVNVQGYSNIFSQNSIAGFGNQVRIKGKYASFSSFQQASIFLTVTLIVLAVSNYYLDYEDYRRSKKVDDFGRDLIYSFQDIASGNSVTRFGSDSGGLNNGDLKTMGDLHYTGEIMFELKTSSKRSVAPLYFRAFTAAEYNDGRWSPPEKKTYKNYDFWENFKTDKFYPQFCAGDAALNSIDNPNYVDIDIRVKNMNPRIFLNEYRMVSSKTNILASTGYEYDNEMLFNTFGGNKSYSQSIVINGIPRNKIYANQEYLGGDLHDLLRSGEFEYFNNAALHSFGTYYDGQFGEEYESFKRNEKEYRAFVLDNYLDYPANMESYLPSDFDSTAQNLYDSFQYSVMTRSYFITHEDEPPEDYAAEYLSEMTDADIYNELIVPQYYNAVIEYVKQIIQSDTEYSLTPGETPFDRDIVEYFLNENKKGYCVHYATAAVLMLRRAGIPARYAEGYFVSDYDLNRKNSEGFSGIPDNNAHAWTEVYYPIIGWQAVEFTPYYSDKELPNENKVTKRTERNTSTDTELTTDTETQTESDTDSEILTDTDTSNKTESIDEKEISSDTDNAENSITFTVEDNGFKRFLKAVGNVLLVILKIVLFLAAIAALWFIVRWTVLKIRYMRFNSDNPRKGVKAMYLHSLLLFRLIDVTPRQNEGDLEFAKRAAYKIDNIKTKEYEEFTNIALNARFGKNLPDEDSVERMQEFIEKLSNSIYSSSRPLKKFIIKYILFLN